VTQAILPASIVANRRCLVSLECTLRRVSTISLRYKLRRDEPISTITNSVDFGSRHLGGILLKIRAYED
jgi:hypothetical protein